MRPVRASTRLHPGDRGHGALEPAGDPSWTPVGADGVSRRFCANAHHDACNWLIPADATDELCRACRHNDMIPDLANADHVAAWREIEFAKHRLFYSLLRWRLPLKTRAEDPDHGLAFEFLADPPDPSAPKVMTGHDNGVITIALAEADPAEVERRRSELDEPYRTVLGHFRHEIGHHYWDVLVRDGGRLGAFRATFGDERQDYAEALQRHYRQKAPPDWRDTFVSAYAAAHPWEDFAETWAHYLHIVDTLDTANAFGLSIAPAIDREGAHQARVDFDPYVSGDMTRSSRPGPRSRRDELHQPRHGAARPLPVRDRAGGRVEARVRARLGAGLRSVFAARIPQLPLSRSTFALACIRRRARIAELRAAGSSCAARPSSSRTRRSAARDMRWPSRRTRRPDQTSRAPRPP